MKKRMGFWAAVLLILLCAAAVADVPIEPATFPDASFRSMVKWAYDKNRDDVLSNAELKNATEFKQNDIPSSGPVYSFRGVEYLENLTTFHCYNQEIEELDLSKNKALKHVIVAQNKKLNRITLGSLPQLTDLNVYQNVLGIVDTTGCPALAVYDCSDNCIYVQDLTGNPDLVRLDCSGNKQFHLFKLSDHQKLEELICSGTNLSDLDLNAFPNIIYVDCSNSSLTRLRIGKTNPYSVLCQGNQLTELDIGDTFYLKQAYQYGEKTDNGSYIQYRSEMNGRGTVLSVDKSVKISATRLNPPKKGDKFTLGTMMYKVLTSSDVAFYRLVWPAKTVVIPDVVTYEGRTYHVSEIYDGTFFQNDYTTTVTIGKNVSVIGEMAFRRATALKTVKGGSGVTRIGKQAFEFCISLKTFPVMNRLKTIDAKAFNGCLKLPKMTLGKAVSSIGKEAFNGCSALKTIVVKTEKLTSKNVKANAFKGIHKKAAFTCPKKMLKEYKKLFVKKGAPKTCKFK